MHKIFFFFDDDEFLRKCINVVYTQFYNNRNMYFCSEHYDFST